jgi:hypothetical protein
MEKLMDYLHPNKVLELTGQLISMNTEELDRLARR